MGYKESLEKMKNIAKNNHASRGTCECIKPETRDRNKLDEYKTGNCPVFEDNICCGCCPLASICDFCVDCGCTVFFQALKGGREKAYFTPASKYSVSKMKEDGKYDWDLYYINTNLLELSKFNKIIGLEFQCYNESTNEADYATILTEPDENNSIEVEFKNGYQTIINLRDSLFYFKEV